MFSKRRLLEYVGCIAAIVLFYAFYFYPQLQGKVLNQSDIVSSNQAGKLMKEYSETTGKTYLWNPAQFGGMPVLAGAPAKNNQTYRLYRYLRLGFAEPMGLFIAGSIMAFFMFLSLGFSPLMSLIFAIPTVFVTGNIILWEAGHNSKIRTLIFTPLLIAGVLNIFHKRRYLLGFTVLALGFAMSFYTRHPQMTYYILLMFMVYGFVVLYDTVKSKDWAHFAKGTGLVIAAVALGMATSASKTWSLYEYSKSTMRGDAILKADNNAQTAGGTSSSNVDGLEWNYAMQWSNNWKDVMAFYIPGAAGGGNSEKVSKSSETYKKYRSEYAPLYHGGLPFTVGPLYLGASILFLFLLGLFVVKGNLKWWLGIGLAWMIALSMGRYLSAFNHVIYDLFPFYSKFRAPQTVINAAPWFVVLMAGLSLREFLGMKLKGNKKNKEPQSSDQLSAVKKAVGVAAGIAIVYMLLGMTMDYSAGSDARYTQQGSDVSVFLSDRRSLLFADSMRTLLFVLGIGGTLWLHAKGKIKQLMTTGIVGLLVLMDLTGVNLRYLDHSKWETKRALRQKTLTERPVDSQIKRIESDPAKYRVHDVTIDAYNSSLASAFHRTIGGYDPAKMQRAQDLIDRHVQRGNMNVFNMMNTKYFIVNGANGQPQVQQNAGALGTAWLVKNVQNVTTPNQEIDALTDFDPASTAVVNMSEFNITKNQYSGEGSISMTSFEPDIITYRSSSPSDQLAVFSEMWYGPNLGWKAYIDGNEVDLVRANYALRALPIPAGQHDIKMEFRPQCFYAGEQISLWSSLLMIGLLIFLVVKELKLIKR